MEKAILAKQQVAFKPIRKLFLKTYYAQHCARFPTCESVMALPSTATTIAPARQTRPCAMPRLPPSPVSLLTIPHHVNWDSAKLSYTSLGLRLLDFQSHAFENAVLLCTDALPWNIVSADSSQVISLRSFAYKQSFTPSSDVKLYSFPSTLYVLGSW